MLQFYNGKDRPEQTVKPTYIYIRSKLIHIQTLENNKKHHGYLLLVLWHTFSFHMILWLRITLSHTKAFFATQQLKKFKP